MKDINIGKIHMVNATYGYQVIKMNGEHRRNQYALQRGYVKVWKVEKLFGEVNASVVDRALTVKRARHIIKRLSI